MTFRSPDHLTSWNQTSSGITLRGNIPGRQWVWNQTVVEQILEIPLWCTLRLPVPEDPPGACLVGIQLCLDVVLQICLVDLRHPSDSTCVLSSAVSNIAASWKGSIISSSRSKAIQPFRAVSLGSSPLSHDEPFICASDFLLLGASNLYVLARGPSDLAGRKYLINVSVKHDIVDPGCSVHEAVPVGINIEKRVVDYDNSVLVIVANVLPTVVVELFDLIHIEGPASRFVEKLDRGHNICVALGKLG